MDSINFKDSVYGEKTSLAQCLTWSKVGFFEKFLKEKNQKRRFYFIFVHNYIM